MAAMRDMPRNKLKTNYIMNYFALLFIGTSAFSCKTHILKVILIFKNYQYLPQGSTQGIKELVPGVFRVLQSCGNYHGAVANVNLEHHMTCTI